MGLRSRMSSLVRNWFGRRRKDAELDAEVHAYLDLLIAENVQKGMTLGEARRAAQAELGGVEQVKEEVRDVRMGAWLGSFLQDVRFGARMLWRSPALLIIAVLTLGLGIGANSAIFSMVDSFLLRPLPVEKPEQIYMLAFQQESGTLQSQFSLPALEDIRTQAADVFTSVAGYDTGLDGLGLRGKADRIVTNFVTGDYFTTLGVRPAAGRFILPSEGKSAGADPVLVLDYAYWKTRFGGDASVIGQKVSLNGHPVTIIGVAPEGFHGVNAILDTQGYLPFSQAILENYPSDFMSGRNQRNLFVLARLKSGVSAARAQAALNVVAQRLAQQYPDTEKGLMLRMYPERHARPGPETSDSLARASVLFLVLAALVLGLACVNVANLVLVRASARQREMATRAALGASRGRLLRQLLTESVLLALLGGAFGIVLGMWASRSLAAMNLQTSLPLRLDFRFDWRVFGYAFTAAMLTGLVVGIVPALRVSRGNLSELLHESSRGSSGQRSRLRNALVVVQVSGSLMLLIVAGLFTRSLGNAQRANLGFDPSHVVNLMLDPNEIGYNEAQSRVFHRNLLERVRALPGVRSATLAFGIPLGYIGTGDTLKIPGYQPPPGQPAPNVNFNMVSTDYFRTLSIPLISGRDFTEADNKDAQYVAIANQAMAAEFWPKQDPLGREFQIASDPKHTIRIVGVAQDSRIRGVRGPVRPYFYTPIAQQFASIVALQVRTAGDPGAMIPVLEREIAAMAPELPIFEVQTMSDALHTLNGLLIYQFGAGLTAALGFLGLILAVVGVYGVVSFAASQRTREIGIRMALGAQPTSVLLMILRQGFLVIGVGVGAGLLTAFAGARLVKNYLVGVSATDPLTYAGVTALLVMVAVAACYIPARRAMKVDPVEALRYE